MTKTYHHLIEHAKKAYELAYAPYSKFQVGAALLAKDGQIISGSNVENASYGLTNCAERSALFAAYSQGYRKNDLEAIAITAKCDRAVSPCGACRQVMSELMHPDTPVILTNTDGEIKNTTVKELLPYTFTSEDF